MWKRLVIFATVTQPFHCNIHNNQMLVRGFKAKPFSEFLKADSWIYCHFSLLSSSKTSCALESWQFKTEVHKNCSMFHSKKALISIVKNNEPKWSTPNITSKLLSKYGFFACNFRLLSETFRKHNQTKTEGKIFKSIKLLRPVLNMVCTGMTLWVRCVGNVLWGFVTVVFVYQKSYTSTTPSVVTVRAYLLCNALVGIPMLA